MSLSAQTNFPSGVSASMLSDSESTCSDTESISSCFDSDSLGVSSCDDESLSEVEANQSDSVINQFKTLKDFLLYWYNHYDTSQSSLSFLLKGLNKFDHPELPLDARTLTKSSNNSVSIEPLGTGTYVHYGIEKALLNQMTCVCSAQIPNDISLNIHIDGLSVSKSSRSQLWPILGEICNSSAFTEPFVIGACHGTGKPSNANTYMEEFVHEYIHLHDVGFVFNDHLHKVNINAVIADTVARNFILCFPPHNSRCGKCLQEGKTVERRRIFLDDHATPRTDENFRTNVPHKYQNLVSPLQGVISATQVSLDPMHLLGHGVTLRHSKLIVKAINRVDNGNLKMNLNSDYCNLKEWVPNDFVRKTRSFDDLNNFKFVELRMVGCYTGPVIFPKYLNPKAMFHFNCYHLATRILSDPDMCIVYNDFARDLYCFYINEMKSLYGEINVVYNVHNLCHLPDDVLKFGNLDEFSAVEFENYLGSLRKMVRNGKSILAQIINRINERAKAKLLNKTIISQTNKVGPGQYSLLRPLNIVGLPVGYSNPYSIIQFSNFNLSNAKPDNCCYLKDGSVFVIEYICKNSNGNTVILGRTFIDCASVENYPVDSRDFDIFKATKLSELHERSIRDIKKKAFRMFFQNSFFIYPILHCKI